MEAELDEEKMQDVRLDNERQCHWRMFSEDNKIGVDNDKFIIYANMWDVYMNKILFLIKGGYYVEVSGSDCKKVIWEVLGSHSVEDTNENNEIGLWGLILICLKKTRVGW